MRFRTILAALAAPLAIAGALALSTAAPALASDNANNAGLFGNVNGDFTNDTCGGANNTNATLDVGQVNYHLSQNADGTWNMMVNIHLKGARPDTTYFVDIWEGFCQGVQFFPAGANSVTTNGNGVGNLTTSTTVPNPAPGGTYWVFLSSFTGQGPLQFVIANSVAVNP
jgi:hypothetical protein